MKRTWGFGLMIVACAFVVGACAHIYDDGIGEGRYDRVTIAHPQYGAQITDDNLDVEGTSTQGSVQVAVFDPYDRLVTRTRLAVRDGRWATSFNLHDGRYRVRVSTRNEEDRDIDEVRVTYRDESLRDGNDWGGRQIAITVPRNDAVVNAGTLEVQGTSATRRVRVQLFDDAGRMVQSVSPDVVESRWRARFDVADGRYWIRASRPGTEGDEVRITYRGALAGGGGVPGDDRVAITYRGEYGDGGR